MQTERKVRLITGDQCHLFQLPTPVHDQQGRQQGRVVGRVTEVGSDGNSTFGTLEMDQPLPNRSPLSVGIFEGRVTGVFLTDLGKLFPDGGGPTW